jgi:hypothetical protein
MQDVRQNVLWMASFVVVAVVMMGAALMPGAGPLVPLGFGPEALPFACDMTRNGAGPQEVTAQFTLSLEQSRADSLQGCGPLARGTALQPRPGGEAICLTYLGAAPTDQWQDGLGGSLQIEPDGAALYIRQERAAGADVFSSPFSATRYLGRCARLQ